MHVVAAILATILVVLLLVVQPARGKRRYERLVQELRLDPRARVRFYARGIAAQWIVVGVVGVIALLASRGPSSIHLSWRHASSNAVSIAILYTIVAVVAVAVSVVVIRRSGPTTINRLRKQVRGFVELIPRSTGERRTFVAVAITAGICEEIVYRGFGLEYLRWLLPDAGELAVILIIGAAFGIAHSYQGPRNVVVTGILGGLLAWLTLVTGTLIPAIAVHMAIDLRVVFLPSSLTEAYEPTEDVPQALAPVPAGWVPAAAGGLITVGSLLPWLSTSTPQGLTVSRNAFQLSNHASTSYDGIELILCGVLLVLVGACSARGRVRRGRSGLAALALSVLALLIALNRWSGLHAVARLGQGALDSTSIGVGFYLVLLGGFIGIVGSTLLLMSRRRSLGVQPEICTSSIAVRADNGRHDDGPNDPRTI